jgi:hypothetical protein
MAEKGSWERYAKPALEVVQALGVLIAAGGLIFTGLQVNDTRKAEAASVALQFDERLRKPQSVAIIDAVENIPPKNILKEHGGSSSEDDVYSLLGDYDTLYYLHEDGLIDDRTVYALFCGDLVNIRRNKEIGRYLQVDRALAAKSDAHPGDELIGYEKMADKCDAWDKSGAGHRMAQ